MDGAIAAFLAIDLFARSFALGSFRRWLKYPITWVDLIVLATLAFPGVLCNWGFLRILRLWALVQSERFWNVLARGRFDDTHVEDLTKAIVTLVTFIFLAAGADAGALHRPASDPARCGGRKGGRARHGPHHDQDPGGDRRDQPGLVEEAARMERERGWPDQQDRKGRVGRDPPRRRAHLRRYST